AASKAGTVSSPSRRSVLARESGAAARYSAHAVLGTATAIGTDGTRRVQLAASDASADNSLVEPATKRTAGQVADGAKRTAIGTIRSPRAQSADAIVLGEALSMARAAMARRRSSFSSGTKVFQRPSRSAGVLTRQAARNSSGSRSARPAR